MRPRWMVAATAMVLVLAACGDDDPGVVPTAAPTTTEASVTTAAAPTTAAAGIGADPTTAEAVENMVASGIDRAAAECFVTRAVGEIGPDQLAAAFGDTADELDPMVGLALLTLLEECGVELEDMWIFPEGGMPSDYREMARPRDEVDGPYTYGDDTGFDALWDACEAGSGAACDELYFESPFGSEYEAYGYTCGNRMELQFDCTLLDE